MATSVSDRIALGLGVFSLFVAVALPLTIFSGQSRMQDRGVCTSAILDLRKEIALLYALGPDANGNVKQADNFSLRVAAQGSRDTVYTVCVDVSDRDDRRIIDPADDPWTQSPSSLASNWSYTNLNNIYEETAASLNDISSAPLWSPAGIPIG